MIYIREGMWETNSSTMNQIIISNSGDSSNYTRKVILHSWLPYEEGEMTNSSAEKINIIWLLLAELSEPFLEDNEPAAVYSDETLQVLKERLPEMNDMFGRVCKNRNIELYRETGEYWNAPLDNFGMEGLTDDFFKLFETDDVLENFLFNQDSWFVFGFSPYNSDDSLGNTGFKVKDGSTILFV